MLSLYEILKASKTGIAPDMWTALAGANFGGAGSGAKVKELTGIPPLSFTANGQPLLDYLISGNMSQSGTPTPSSPIQPSECGERTGNLFDISQVVTNTQVINQGSSLKVMIPSTTTGVNAAMPNTLQDYCPTLNVGDEVTLSFKTTGSSKFIHLSGGNIAWGSGQSKTITATMLSSVVTWYASGRDTEAVISNIMLNLGSTALPYEPYGYKIPISSANTTTPVYLGEVVTTRKIKKLVFNGTENWRQSGDGNFYIPLSPNQGVAWVRVFSTHFKSSQVQTNGRLLWFVNANVDFDTVEECKSYLAAQYAAGTPVTVWYVLANEETAVVNEPLRKIGDYADTLSMEQAGVQIPTNKGNTVINVETTLKPSEMYIKYQG